jgi:hypothetical protein
MTRTDGLLVAFIVALLGLDAFAVIGKLEIGAAAALGAAAVGMLCYGISWLRDRRVGGARTGLR